MKKLLALLLVCTLFACEREPVDTQDTQEVANLTLNTGTCNLVNSNRFTERAVTYYSSCDNHPSEDCFVEEMPRKINTEVLQYYNFKKKGAQNKTLIGNYSIKSSQNSNQETLQFSELMDPDIDLYPYIEIEESNKVYREVLCQIIEEIDALPTLNISTQKYKVTVTYISVDHELNPTAAYTHLTLYYKIERYDF